MELIRMKSKIHQATVTGVDMHYEGSIVIDSALMEEVGLVKWEKVLVANMNTGDRFETYVIPAPARSGKIELNGATASLGHVGDRVIIFSFGTYSEVEARKHPPRIVQVDEENKVVRRSFATS